MKHSRVTFNLDLGYTISDISIPIKKTAKVLNIILMENGQPYEIESDCKVVFYAKKPDGNVLYNDCIVKDNVVEYQLTTQTIALAGIVECELLVYGEDSSTPIHSPSFTLVNYEPVFDGGEAIESTNEFTALTQAMGTLETLIDQAKDVIGSNADDYIIHAPNYIPSNTTPSDIEFGTHICAITEFDSTLPESDEEYTVQGTLEVIKAFDSIDCIRMYWHPCGSHNVYSRLPVSDKNWSEWETAQSGGGVAESVVDEKIATAKRELIGTADDAADKDTIKGAKQLALDLMHGLEDKVVKTTELNNAINSALSQAKASGEFDGADGYTPQKGVDYWTETDKEEIVDDVVAEIPLIKVAEQPTFVNSVDEMTDTSKAYVLSTDGYFYRYREIKNYNLFKISEVSFSSRLQNDVAGITSSTTGNFVTGWIPVKYGKYYGVSILFEGERKIKNMSYQRANLKLSDGTIIVYNKSKVPYVAIDGCKILDIKYTNAVSIQLHFTVANDSESILDTPNADVLSTYKPMMVEADTPEDAYSKALNAKYIDGDAESGAEWYNTGLAYNQPANYEERVIKVESDVSDIKKDLADFQDDLSNIKDNLTNPASMSPYYRSVNYGLLPFNYYQGVAPAYEKIFRQGELYADFITSWKSLVASHSTYVTETELGMASDGQKIYSYNFKPARISNQKNDIPKIIIIAGQHGFEKSNIYGLYYFVDNLLNRWTEHPTLEYFRNHVELLIIPVLNTYGFDHLEYKNANGVNLNRNYDSNWEYLNDVTSTQYGGEVPFDQPETQIVRDLLNSNKDASLVIDFHTNGGASVTKYEDVNWCAICPNTDTYYNRMLDAVAYHLSALTAHFNIDYALNQPDVMMGHMTTNSGTGLLRSWATDNNFVGVLIEGFNGFPNEEHFIGRVYKANEEIIANYLIAALNYLSK